MTVDSLVSHLANTSGILFRVYDSDGAGIAEFWNSEYEKDFFSSLPVREYRLMLKGSIPVVRIDLKEKN